MAGAMNTTSGGRGALVAQLNLFNTDLALLSSGAGTTPGGGKTSEIPQQINIYTEPSKMILGRGVKSDILLSAQKDGKFIISRQHAAITVTSANTNKVNVVIEDLDSLNGVYVNDVRIKREVLKDGDVIQFGGMSDVPIGGILEYSDISIRYRFNLANSSLGTTGGTALPPTVPLSTTAPAVQVLPKSILKQPQQQPAQAGQSAPTALMMMTSPSKGSMAVTNYAANSPQGSRSAADSKTTPAATAGRTPATDAKTSTSPRATAAAQPTAQAKTKVKKEVGTKRTRQSLEAQLENDDEEDSEDDDEDYDATAHNYDDDDESLEEEFGSKRRTRSRGRPAKKPARSSKAYESDSEFSLSKVAPTTSSGSKAKRPRGGGAGAASEGSTAMVAVASSTSTVAVATATVTSAITAMGENLQNEVKELRQSQQHDWTELKQRFDSLQSLLTDSLLQDKQKGKSNNADLQKELEKERQKEKEREKERELHEKKLASKEREVALLMSQLKHQQEENERMQSQLQTTLQEKDKMKDERDREKREREKEKEQREREKTNALPATPSAASQVNNSGSGSLGRSPTITGSQAIANCNIDINIVKQQLTCVICKSLFVNAVVMRCSHAFCRHCIEQHLHQPYSQRKCTCVICHDPPTSLTAKNQQSLYYQSCQLDELVWLIVEASPKAERDAYQQREEEAYKVLKKLQIDPDKPMYEFTDAATNMELMDTAKQSKANPKVQQKSGSSKSSVSESSSVVCSFCAEAGHEENRCPYKREESGDEEDEGDEY